MSFESIAPVDNQFFTDWHAAAFEETAIVGCRGAYPEQGWLRLAMDSINGQLCEIREWTFRQPDSSEADSHPDVTVIVWLEPFTEELRVA